MFEGNLLQDNLVVTAASFLKRGTHIELDNKMDFKFSIHASAYIKVTLLLYSQNLFQLFIDYV